MRFDAAEFRKPFSRWRDMPHALQSTLQHEFLEISSPNLLGPFFKLGSRALGTKRHDGARINHHAAILGV